MLAILQSGQRLDIDVDVGRGVLDLSVMVIYTYVYGDFRYAFNHIVRFQEQSTTTLLERPPVRSTRRKEIENIVFRNLGPAKPIVTLTIVEPVEGQPDKTFILHSQDLKEVMPIYDLAGQFAEYANS